MISLIQHAIRNSWILALLTAILMLLAFPGFNVFPIAWFSLVPLVYVLYGTSSRRNFLMGWLSGTVFFTGLLYWIAPLYPYTQLPLIPAVLVTVLATLALAAYLGLYWGAFASLVARWKGPLLLQPFFAAACWTGLEYMRAWALTGMPWGSLGYSQWNNLPAIQIADTIGVYGISFVIVVVNVYVVQIWQHHEQWKRLMVIPGLLLMVTFGYGLWRLSHVPEPSRSLDVALIPGNIKQMDKWQGQKLDEIFNRYLRTTKQLTSDPPDVFVWPETAVPMNLLAPGRARYFSRLYDVLRELDRPMLFGTPYLTERKSYNAVFLLDAFGRPIQHYYKIHLVPFGESVPFKKWIPRSMLDRLVGRGDYDPGNEIRLFDLPKRDDVKLGVVICFESVFPRLFRKSVKEGANIMGILTNDAWFEGTAAPEQHDAMAPFRAVENRVPIFRCANGGISCIIDSFGRIQPSKIVAPERGIVRGNLSPGQHITLYTRFGNWFPFLCWLFTLGYVLRLFIRKQWRRRCET